MLMATFLLFSYCLIVVKNKAYHGELETPGILGGGLDHEGNVAFGRESHVSDDKGQVPICPPVPPDLRGRINVLENVTVEEAESTGVTEGVKQGGFWWPSHCQARWRVAIIVPYRNRASQLGSFLHHMHNFLQRQELNYSIYVIEQEGDDLFNRARLLNVGYSEAQREGPWDCFAFHDIDMLPEDDRHLYHCSPQPRHLAVATSNHKYKLVYDRYFGGACLMTDKQIKAVNGWSNRYWGWGGEDDDMWRRIAFEDMHVWRYPGKLARYKTIKHRPQVLNKNRFEIVSRNTGRYTHDGLNSLNYTVRNITRKLLYTHILANIGSSRKIASSSVRHRKR
ncbi:hypothetical protein SK128_001679 [Halocaridina rubra]|uniref:Beta-1,4-N-acetylgalactosaminyltransferase n=1 Tax=Halocaridina rubra TaxID=373956 RepID=A0AAN8WUE7_HALRR